MAETWMATIEMWDHGVWDPADEEACRRIIAKVQEARLQTDRPPMLRRDYDGGYYLRCEIEGEVFTLSKGQHLVAGIMPSTAVYWTGMAPEELADLRPAPPVKR